MSGELTTQILILDVYDASDINAAVARFQVLNEKWDGALLPEGNSTKLAAILAEICRDWLESH